MRTAEDTGSRDADTVTGGLLITGTHAGERTTVEALRLEDGLTIWWYDSRLRFEDLVCQDGMVFVSSFGRGRPGRFGPAAIVALRAEDGAKLWHIGPPQFRRQVALRRAGWGLRALWMTSSPTQAWHAMKSLELEGYTYLAAAEGVVLACKEHVIFALDVRTGAVRWMYPTLSSIGRPLITAHGNMVLIQGDYGALHALDARTGRKRWSSEGRLHIERHADTPVVNETYEKYMYIPHTYGRPRVIITLRVADGRREQVLPLADGETPATVTPDGIAYLTRAARLRAVRVADGAELWQSARLRDAPDYGNASSWSAVRVAAGERIVFYGYVCEGESHVLIVGGLDAQTGASLWEWCSSELPPQQRSVALIAAQGNVYVIAMIGIFAFQGKDGKLLWQAPGGVSIARVVLPTDSLALLRSWSERCSHGKQR